MKVRPEDLGNAIQTIVHRAAVEQGVIDEFFDEIAPLIRDELGAGMKAGRGPDGEPFPALLHARPSGGSTPLMASGALYESVAKKDGRGHTESRSGHKLTMESNLPYSLMQQEGQTTTPKRAQNLTIPLTAEAERSKAREFPGNLVIRFRHEPVGLEDDDGTLHYLFRKEVRNVGRRFMDIGMSLSNKIIDAYRKVVERRAAKT